MRGSDVFGAAARGLIHIVPTVIESDRRRELRASIRFAANAIARETVDEICDHWVAALTALARYSEQPDAGGLTPSDLPMITTTQAEIETWEQKHPRLADVWPLSPLQAGMLFHAQLAEGGVDVYTMQLVMDLTGNIDGARLRRAADAVLARHSNLGRIRDAGGRFARFSSFSTTSPTVGQADLSALSAGRRDEEVRRIIDEDRVNSFAVDVAPLIRLTLIRTGTDDSKLLLTNHHMLLDGWSTPLVLTDLMILYATDGDDSALRRLVRRRSFWRGWISRSGCHAARERSLRGVEPTLMATLGDDLDSSGSGSMMIPMGAESTSAITDLASRLGITVNTVLQVAWALLLARQTGRDDVVFGATVSGLPRNWTISSRWSGCSSTRFRCGSECSPVSRSSTR